MTREEAMELMVGGAFQEEDEATGKWLRARLTSTQLSTYYVGSQEMWDLEVESGGARRPRPGQARTPSRRSASPAASATRPASSSARISRSVIAHGTPPIKWLRRILLDPAA